jgi:hypothetical protein
MLIIVIGCSVVVLLCIGLVELNSGVQFHHINNKNCGNLFRSKVSIHFIESICPFTVSHCKGSKITIPQVT